MSTLCSILPFDLAPSYMGVRSLLLYVELCILQDKATEPLPHLHPFVGVLLSSLGVGDKAAA